MCIIYLKETTMKQLSLATCLLALACLSSVGAQAQTLSDLKIEPAAPKVGEQVKITLEFTNADTPNCGMKIVMGDGRTEAARINQVKDLPYVLTHTYTKPGNYTVIAEPKRSGSSLKCSGKDINKAITVAAVVAPVAAAPAPAAAASAATVAAAKPASVCPAGWTLTKAGVNQKTKAFSCFAKADTKIPEPKVSCPSDLTYYENSKKGQLGCRV
jgi:ribosomal protein L12E/L44/L45/RPP1/RPP2